MKTKILNLRVYKSKRKSLRCSMTQEEIILWRYLKNKQTGYKFRRQQGIGKYITDFYCPELKLAIEIDGGHHFENTNLVKDKKRTEYLNKFGIKVKRYTNLDIKNNLDSVVRDIIGECEKIANHPPTPLPSFAQSYGRTSVRRGDGEADESLKKT